jgi:hypothetical protein
MNELSNYEDVLNDVKDSLDNLINNALEKNISKKNIIVDPGIGFSKDIIHNLEILKNLDAFKKWNLPILIGASRKRLMDLNPNSFRIIVGTLLEVNGRGYWETSDENIEQLKEIYQEVEDKIEGVKE